MSYAGTLSGFRGAKPAHSYVHITRRQHPKSGVRPRRGKLGDVIVIINVAYIIANVAILIERNKEID